MEIIDRHTRIVLWVIYHQGKTRAELMKDLNIEKRTISRYLESACKNGWLRRMNKRYYHGQIFADWSAQ